MGEVEVDQWLKATVGLLYSIRPSQPNLTLGSPSGQADYFPRFFPLAPPSFSLLDYTSRLGG